MPSGLQNDEEIVSAHRRPVMQGGDRELVTVVPNWRVGRWQLSGTAGSVRLRSGGPVGQPTTGGTRTGLQHRGRPAAAEAFATTVSAESPATSIRITGARRPSLAGCATLRLSTTTPRSKLSGTAGASQRGYPPALAARSSRVQ